MKKHQWLGIVCGALCIGVANAQTLLESFEYNTDDELLAAWMPSGNTVITLSDSVAPRSTGKKSMRVDFTFASMPWTTETIHGVDLPNLVSIGANQYITFRLRGDAAFAVANYQQLFLYAYDDSGNFGRWGTAVPLTNDWQVVNFLVSSIQQPWDQPVPPDFGRIVKFAFFQYGSSETPIDSYPATIYIDDLMVTDKPLTEFPLPAAPRSLIDNFEGYADNAALGTFYSYENGGATTVTTASLETPAPQGSKALKLAIDFAPGQWPWGSVISSKVAPFSLPTNAVVSFRLKGDPSLASVSDGGTVFWLSFYDAAGNRINYISTPAPVTSPDWTTLEARIQDFGDTSTVDIGNLVRWRILVEGWQGTAEQAAMSGAFYVDDIQINVPPTQGPSLSVFWETGVLKLGMTGLISGTNYELHTSANLSQWSTATVINATSTSATWTPAAGQPAAFFRLLQK